MYIFTPKHPVSLSSVVMALGWFLRKLEYRSRFLDNHLFLNFYQFLQNFFKVKEGEIDFVISERFFGFVLAANIKKLRFFRSREKNRKTYTQRALRIISKLRKKLFYNLMAKYYAILYLLS